MRFDLHYGAGLLPLEIQERTSYSVAQPMTIDTISDIDRKFLNAIENPVGVDSFSHVVSEAKSVTVVVNSDADFDLTTMLLNKLLNSIHSSISGPTEVVVLTTNDIEEPEEDHNRINYRIIHHDAHSNEELDFVGETPTHCTPVYINSAFLNADLKIGIGTIRSNIFVGATGGRMSAIPYSAGIKSITRNSKLQTTHPVGPFQTESATSIDLTEASQLAGLDFIINAIPDWKDNIHEMVAGNPFSSWIHGVSVARGLTESFYTHKADIAIVSAGGATYDRTLFDAVDALHAGKEATEHGGVIVLIAECADGVGSDGFMRGVSECSSHEEVALLAETNFENGMEKSRFFWEVLNSRKIIICSRLRPSLIAERFHCSAVKDPQEGYELARSLIVSSPRVAIIPHGPRTLPIMKNS